MRDLSLILISCQLYSASNPHHDSKPSNEMALHSKRILVTDTSNDEDGHSRHDRADIYIQCTPTLFCNSLNSTFSFTVSSYRTNIENISYYVKCNV